MIEDFSEKDLAGIEASTKEIGRELFDHLHLRKPSMWQRRWWEDRILAWAMQDESVKVQMFRFIDVLPMLKTSEEITQHLHEYFDDVKKHLPTAARLAMAAAPAESLTGRALAVTARRNAMSHARRFIAGTNAAEVMASAMRQRKLKRAFTLDILGEAVISDVESDRFLQSYIGLIEGIAPTVNSWPELPQVDVGVLGKLPRVNLSIKLSALDSHFDAIDPAGVYERLGPRLRKLLRVARDNDSFINVDMESYAVKDLTLWLFKRILMEDEFRDWGDVGIVIQAYLKDSGQDLHELRQWAEDRGKPVWVRLVKGAYWDYETVIHQQLGWPVPVFSQKWQTDANFEKLARYLIRNYEHLRPALGSHNIRSIAHGIATARHVGLPAGGLELQMLYGMGDEEKDVLVKLGHRVRVYMPYGELIPGMAYLVRRLLENTSNDSFLRASVTEHVPPEKLLMNPEPSGANQPAAQENSQPVHSGPAVLDEFENEPWLDFSQEENRRAMQQAIDEVGGQLGRHDTLWIGGEAVSTGEKMTSLNPSDISQVVGTVDEANVDRAQQAVAAAREAQAAWARRDVKERADFLRQTAAVMRRRRLELAAWEAYECGKTWREADGDVTEAIDFCEYYALMAEAMWQREGVDLPGEDNRLRYRPRGVAAIISPWNFPLAILTGMTTAALVTGNAVVMKPAEQASIIGALLMEIFREIELPAGVANYLPGRGEVVGAALVDHPDVALIAFTGSRQVGLQINQRAAELSASGECRFVKKAIAEMGGKNAIIVDADADLDEAVAGVVKSAFGFQGQKCSACSRAIVLESAYDQFLERLVEAARSLELGPATAPGTNVGPVIDAEARDKIQQYIELGRQEGREVLSVNPGELKEKGYFIGPHIFADVAPDARIAQEEIFGPVLAVLRAKDLDEAIAIANGTDYALTGGFFSRSPANIERVSSEFEVGNLYINRASTGAMVSRQPFGGFKMSGIGSQAGGPDYLLQFVLPRTITENTIRRGFAPSSVENG